VLFANDALALIDRQREELEQNLLQDSRDSDRKRNAAKDQQIENLKDEILELRVRE
jgi:hypothetical protein